jgi:hypothetical protein
VALTSATHVHPIDRKCISASEVVACCFLLVSPLRLTRLSLPVDRRRRLPRSYFLHQHVTGPPGSGRPRPYLLYGTTHASTRRHRPPPKPNPTSSHSHRTDVVPARSLGDLRRSARPSPAVAMDEAKGTALSMLDLLPRFSSAAARARARSSRGIS